MRVLVIFAIVVLVGAAAAGGVVAFIVLRVEGHPPDQTAKFLPTNTQVYFSVNLRPDTGQLRKFQDLLQRFRRNPGFQSRIDELVDDAEAQTGIDLEEDVLGWLGPEIGIGLIDVIGSAISGGTGGPPIMVALISTTDHSRALRVLRDWIAYLESETGFTFTSDVYRGVTVFSDDGDTHHYAMTEDYLLVASDRPLLEDTIDRILDGDTDESLHESRRFLRALEALPDQRFSTLYVNTEAVWLDARRQFGAEIPAELRLQLDDAIPEWVAVTGTVIDRGAELLVSAAATKEASQTAPMTNSLSSAGLLPSDTIAFLSFAFEPNLDPIKEQLEKQAIADFDPNVSEALKQGLGLDISEESTFADILDKLLQRFEEAYGLDLESDVLAWMTGQLSFALLPTDFRALREDATEEAVDALAIVQFEAAERNAVDKAVETVVGLLEKEGGLERKRVSYSGAEGAVFDVQVSDGPGPYRPGYLVIGDHLVIATTDQVLEVAASIARSTDDSLSREPEYRRLVDRATGLRNPVVYLNIRGIREAVVDALDTSGQEQYRKSVEPFLEPLRALLVAGDTMDGATRVLITVTVE